MPWSCTLLVSVVWRDKEKIFQMMTNAEPRTVWMSHFLCRHPEDAPVQPSLCKVPWRPKQWGWCNEVMITGVSRLPGKQFVSTIRIVSAIQKRSIAHNIKAAPHTVVEWGGGGVSTKARLRKRQWFPFWREAKSGGDMHLGVCFPKHLTVTPIPLYLSFVFVCLFL